VAENPDYLIGQMRVQTMREQPFFYVAGRPTAMSELDAELDRLIPLLEAAQAEAGIADTGPVIIRYYLVEAPDTFLMEVGVPAKAGTASAGEAQIQTLPPYPCASLLYWGSLKHIQEAYGALIEGIRKAGLERAAEGREWYYYFEGDGSPNNVIGLHLAIRPEG
jgi:effector-binding domain-containing protein